MNKQGIALAADSAVTFRVEMGQKIFTSASKIFRLSKYQTIGAMVYGDANFMGVPWETIVKLYRSKLGTQSFEHVSEYAEELLDFLNEDERLTSDEEQERYVRSCIIAYFHNSIRKEITDKVEQKIEDEGEIDDSIVRNITSQAVQNHFDDWKDSEMASTIPADFLDKFRKKYGRLISEAKKAIFEDLPLTRGSSRQLTEIAVNLFTRFPEGLLAPNTTGVVIAGFGTDDIFPVLEAFSIEGRIDNFLKHKRIDSKCARVDFETSAVILPFAQSEMVYAFMEGVDPGYQALIDEYLGQICNSYPQVLVDEIAGLEEETKEELKAHLKEIGKRVFIEYRNRLSKHGQKSYVSPVMSVVQALPKDELAAMAESLINLTSFKRRVSLEDETVGGPIDVAIISKGDGFVWIKRKHYFEPELNHHFFTNYHQEDKSNDIESGEEKDSEGISFNEGV